MPLITLNIILFSGNVYASFSHLCAAAHRHLAERSRVFSHGLFFPFVAYNMLTPQETFEFVCAFCKREIASNVSLILRTFEQRKEGKAAWEILKNKWSRTKCNFVVIALERKLSETMSKNDPTFISSDPGLLFWFHICASDERSRPNPVHTNAKFLHVVARRTI